MSTALTLLRHLADNAVDLLRGGYLLVEDGEGFEDLPETLPLTSGASAWVVRVGSELALRHALWKARPAPVVALVPEALDLPADLRLGAARQRVHTLSGDEVLSALLSTRVTGVDDDDLRRLALENLESLQGRLAAKTTPTVIDRALLERTLVEVLAELQDLRSADGQLATVLAGWIVAPPAWPAAVRRLAQSTLQAHGDAGRVLAWALDDAAVRLRALFVHGALLGVEGEVPDSVWGPLAALRDERTSPLRAPALARVAVDQLVHDACSQLRHAARPLLDEADTLARRLLPSAQLQSSRLLPLAFEERAHAIATALARLESPSRDAFRALRRHALVATSNVQLDLLDDLDRLVRYLKHPRTPPPTAADMASVWLADHAHADRCARQVERALASVPAHHAEARAVLQEVHRTRDEVNLAYATALSRSYVSTLYDPRVVALQNVVRDVLAVRQKVDAPRVFLLVLDGCSVPVFLDLLDQLSAQKHRIGLERGSEMKLRYQAGLSPLPTITSHARGALFLGAVPKDPFAAETQWRDVGERVTDPARFKQNLALATTPRQLFLKGDLADGGAGLRSALRGDTPLVAAVFNAVDDRIGSHDTGAAWRLEVEDITGLLPALDAALGAGRKVLVTSDHGHSPFRGTALRVGAGSTPRYVRLKAGDAVPDGFVEIDCADLAGEPGRTAFAWRSGVYRGAVQVGFHGGCALEEMVVPVAWLARDGDPADKPAWWHEGAAAPDAIASRPAAPVALLLPVPPAVSPVAALPVPPSSGALPSAVLDLPLARPQAPIERIPLAIRVALDEPPAVEAVAWILADGPIRTAVLAQRLGRPAVRVQGWLTKINRVLAEHGARLEAETLPDLQLQWRYVGPQESA